MEEFGLDLRDVVREYLEHNGLSLGYMSRATKINKTALFTWLKGERDLSAEYIRKIRGFLSGNFLIDVQSIIGNLLIMKELDKEENNNAE